MNTSLGASVTQQRLCTQGAQAKCSCIASTSSRSSKLAFSRGLSTPSPHTFFPRRTGRQSPTQHSLCVQAGPDQEQPSEYNKEFGYSRKDILLIGGGLLGVGIGAYYGLQAVGVEPGMAGNFVQFGIFVLFSVGWISSYLIRVLNKDMTYTKQLDSYENAVMNKRLEEMPESERERLYTEIEEERQRKLERQRQKSS